MQLRTHLEDTTQQPRSAKQTRLRLLKPIVALVIASLVVTTSCGEVGTSQERSLGRSLPLKLGVFPAELYFTEYVARQQGLFSKNGLSVEFITPKDGPTALRLVATNRVNGYLSATENLINAAGSGLDVKGFSSVYNVSLTEITIRNGISAPKGNWRERMRILKGKTIGVPGIDSSQDMYLRRLLRAVGLNPKRDVSIISVAPVKTAAAQFKQGQLDAYVYASPSAVVMQEAGAGDLLVRVADLPEQYSKTLRPLVVNSEWAQNHPETLRRWRKATEDAMNWISDPKNFNESLKYFAKLYLNGKVDAARPAFENLVNNIYPTARPALKAQRSSFVSAETRMVKGGQIKSDVAQRMSYRNAFLMLD